MSQQSAMLLEGNAHINPFDPDTQAWTGFEPKLEIAKLAIQPNSEIKRQMSKGRGTYGQVRATVAIPQPADLSVTIRDATSKTLALSLMGIDSALEQAASTVSDDTVTAVLGKYVDLAQRNLAIAGITVTDGGATPTTYAEGVDYEINHRFGWLRALPDGAIEDGAELTVGYSVLATAGARRIRGATKPSLRCRIRFDGRNMVNGRNVLGDFYDVTLTPTSELDLMSEEFAELELQGTMTTPEGKDEPFVLDLY